MIKILREYINYKLNAKGRHGVHSPFVYGLVDQALRTKSHKNVYKRFKNYKKRLRNDSSTINVNDLGAGSKKLSKQRKIQDIARISGSSRKYGKLLFKLVNHYEPKTILELGTSLGLGTFMLVNGNPKSKIITIEGCRQTSAIAQKMHKKFESKNVEFVVNDFASYLKHYSGSKFDFIFIDGDHRGDKLIKTLDQLNDHIHDETILFLDDIRWSKDMLKTWNDLTLDERYHLSIDFFQMGLLMPRKHQEKEHFVIDY